MRLRFFLPLFFALVGLCVRAAEVLPPAPAAYLNDYAGIVSPDAARQLDAELKQFERDTSNQIVVAIFPSLPPGAAIEDYTVRLAQKWRVGQKERDNGAVLFLFQASRDIRIETGYGLEGTLTDALCKRIIEDEMVPRFRQGDFTGGVQAGVRAMMAATKGEYQGTGRTGGDGGKRGSSWFFILMVIVLFVIMPIFQSRRNTIYGRSGRSTPWISTGGGGWSGGGGGGGFSGGGGGFGGGGAGGKW